jgi:DNA-binding GntR family transcriptional regulator
VGATAAPGPAPTAQDRAAAALRGAILEGLLRPGQRVSQEEWAARAGVSLIPLREALRALAGEGLVEYRPRRGYAVTELDLGDLEEVYRLRATLESDALRRGVPRATPRDVAELERAAAACARAHGVAERLAANRRFHAFLHALAGSRVLSRLIDLLWDSTEAYRALYYSLEGETAEADRAHAEIVAAVAAGDAARATALQDAHRERALARLRDVLAGGDQPSGGPIPGRSSRSAADGAARSGRPAARQAATPPSTSAASG